MAGHPTGQQSLQERTSHGAIDHENSSLSKGSSSRTICADIGAALTMSLILLSIEYAPRAWQLFFITPLNDIARKGGSTVGQQE